MAPLAVFAQNNTTPARITAQINESNLTTLRGNTHPLARPQFDQGAVADSQPMRRMLLLLQRSPQQEAALRALIDQQQSGGSPNFHQWLTPQQFGQQFGPSSADVQTVTNWLQSHGFQIARVSTGGTLIEFSGTAGQVRGAFHTEIHRYTVNGQEHLANSSEPQIPAALAPVVAGPVSLHNFYRRPQSRVKGVFQKDRNSGKVAPAPAPSFSFTNSNCSSNPIFASDCYAVGPGDFATIYNVNPLWTTGISSHVIDGTGQTIAIVGDSEICTASSPDFSAACTVDDVASFRQIFGLSTANLPTVILDGPDPGFNSDEIEGNLDVQWSGAIAKNATIDFVIAEGTEASAGTDLAAEYIVDNNLAPVMSESFSDCEASLGTAGNQFESALWEQAAAQGITVIVSAGDTGSAGCDADTQFAAVNGPNVNGIASTPFNTAAGGTDFDFTTANYPAAYWSTSNSTVNGVPDVSAMKYIPETPWNDSCARAGATGCNSLSADSPLLNIVGGGGGQSNCIQLDFSGTQCLASYPKPAYQLTATGSGLTTVNDLSRDLPDISLFASDGLVSNSFFIVCEVDITVQPCDLSQSFINFVGVGGTSSSAPAFAGLMALVNQNMALNHPSLPARQGNANYVLYPLFAAQQTAGTACNSSFSPNSLCTFNDITSGNNSVPCAGTSPGCSNTTSQGALGVLERLSTLGAPIPGTLAFSAGTGYDLATGLGSINAFNLVSNWATEVGSFTPTTTTLCLSSTNGGCASSTSASSVSTITHGSTVYVSIGVTSGSGAPPASTSAKAEDVALIGTFPAPPCTVNCTQGVDRFDANTGNADIYPLASGGTISASTNELVGGTYTISARYGGDGKFGSSSSTPGVSITVNPENSSASVTVLTATAGGGVVASSSVPYGAVNFVRADVTGTTSGLETGTGTVTLQDNSGPIIDPSDTPATLFPLNTEGYAEDQTPFLSVGAHSFTATYGGDASYHASAVSTAVPLTVTSGPTTTSVNSSVTSIAPNTNFTLTASVDTQSSANPTGGSFGLSPSGTVTFKSGATVLGTVPVTTVASGDVNGYDESMATFSTAQLTTSGTITAVYNGDANYIASTSAGVGVTVTNGATFSLSASNSGTIPGVTPGQQGTDTITVTGSGGFSGTVTLTVSAPSPSNLSDPPSCSFGSTGSVVLNSGANPPVNSGAGTLTCSTTAASALFKPASRPQSPNWLLYGESGAVIACIFALAIAGQKRRGMALLVTVLAAIALFGASCGSGGAGNPGNTNPGTAGPQSYTFTVTGTPTTGAAQTIEVTLNVQ